MYARCFISDVVNYRGWFIVIFYEERSYKYMSNFLVSEIQSIKRVNKNIFFKNLSTC